MKYRSFPDPRPDEEPFFDDTDKTRRAKRRADKKRRDKSQDWDDDWDGD